MNWMIFLSLGAMLSFSAIGNAEEDDTYYDDFSVESEELSIEEEAFPEEVKEQEEIVREEVENPVKNFSQKIKAEAPVKLIKEAPPQKENVREVKAQTIDKIQVAENDESASMQIDGNLQETESFEQQDPVKKSSLIEIDFRQVFDGAPIIYTLLSVLSVVSFSIWAYSMLTIRSSELLPAQLIKDLKGKLISNQFTDALQLCHKERHFFCKMVATGILARKQGLGMMVEMMKAEGKRSTIGFWQRLNLLNDIAIIAPMLGLLGTVMGMFYAFYDLHRSSESLMMLFDGLGISVGTTIAGLVVAIVAMVLHSIAKYRLIKALATLENEAQGIAALIETKGPSYLEV